MTGPSIERRKRQETRQGTWMVATVAALAVGFVLILLGVIVGPQAPEGTFPLVYIAAVLVVLGALALALLTRRPGRERETERRGGVR